MNASISDNTIDAYNTGLYSFQRFRTIYKLPELWSPTVEQIVMFISWLSLQGLAHSTARLYVKAIGFQCKMKNVTDVSRHYVVEKALEGFKRSSCGTPRDCRLPITPNLLHRILSVIPVVCLNLYESSLFSAAFSLAFAAFLRVSELAVKNIKSVSNVLLMSDVDVNEKEGMVKIVIRYSKTDQCGVGAVVIIRRTGSDLCAVTRLIEFLKRRPPINGPFFCHLNGKPLTRYQFSAVLKKSICGFGPHYGKFTSHSFRIGAATAAAMAGYSVETIKKAGRWRSDAYRRYLKPESVLTLPMLA